MTIPEIVEKYTIRANPNKNLCVRREILKHEDDKAYIKEHRDEIIAYIEEQKAIEEQQHLERLKKMNAIEGLQELEDASIAWKEYYIAYRRFIVSSKMMQREKHRRSQKQVWKSWCGSTPEQMLT